MTDQSKRHDTTEVQLGETRSFLEFHMGVWVRGYLQREEPLRGSRIPESPSVGSDNKIWKRGPQGTSCLYKLVKESALCIWPV